MDVVLKVSVIKDFYGGVVVRFYYVSWRLCDVVDDDGDLGLYDVN